MRSLIVVLMFLAARVMAADAPLRLEDFAYGMTLEGETAGALYGFDLPEEVYHSVVRADLGDLRVFNAQGEVVPHLLQQPAAEPELPQSVSLPFFPLFVEAGHKAGETTLRIVPDQQGALIDLHSRSGDQGGKVISHYIIDASAIRKPISRLQLQWRTGGETFVANITVDASDDLNQWRSIARASLVDLLYEGYHLQRNKLMLKGVTAKYLRISWAPGEKQVELSGVEAVVAQPGSELPLHWTTAENSEGDGIVGHYRFVVNGQYPIEALDVVLPQQNTVVKAGISSSPGEAGDLRRVHYQGVIYALQHEGHTLASGPITIGRTPHRYWQLDVDQQNGGLGGGQPQLKLGWRPQRLVYVARGTGPFTLAFGSISAEALRVDSSLQGLLTALQNEGDRAPKVHPVVPQAVHILGGEQRLTAPPPPLPPLPWKKWLLWAILLLGVAAMLLMARSLYRQMNSGNGEKL